MDINCLTIGEVKEIAALVNNSCTADNSPWIIGKNYLIRTVTMILTGRLVAVGSKEISLIDAAWIADTGRFADSVRDCEFKEVEPFPSGHIVIVGRGSIIDAVEISDLPRTQK